MLPVLLGPILMMIILVIIVCGLMCFFCYRAKKHSSRQQMYQPHYQPINLQPFHPAGEAIVQSEFLISDDSIVKFQIDFG